MSEFSSKLFVAVLLVFALVVVSPPAARAQGALSASGGPQLPSPFQFEIEEITLKLGGKVVLHDQFQRQGGLRPAEIEGRKLAAGEGPEYRIDLGQISSANVRDGILKIDQSVTSNIWHGPQGNYGHTLHRNDSYVSMFTLPVNAAGGMTFLANETGGLEFSVRIRAPHLSGFEKLKVGLMDTEAYRSLAAVSFGRLPLPASPATGAADQSTNILDLVSQPAIVLGRVEEPRVRGEIVLDYAKIERSDEIKTLEMVLRVSPEGRVSGLARIDAGGQVKVVELEPRSEERAVLPANLKLAATLFAETLPAVEVNRVYPREVAVRDLGVTDRVRFRIEGFGFGPDSRVEIVPQEGAPIPAAAIHREKVAVPEGTVLLADIGLPARVGSYSLRVTTGGQSTLFENAVRVFSPSATASVQVP